MKKHLITILLLLLACIGAQAQTPNLTVEWQKTRECVVQPDGGLYAATRDDWKRGALSSNALEPGKDGAVEFTIADFGGNNIIIGLVDYINGYNNTGWNGAITYGFKVEASKVCYVVINSSTLINLGVLPVNTVLKVQRIGTQVQWLMNNTIITATGCPGTGNACKLETTTDPYGGVNLQRLYVITDMCVGYSPAVRASFGTPLKVKPIYPEVNCGQPVSTENNTLRIEASGGTEKSGGGYTWEQYNGTSWVAVTAISNTYTISNPVIGTQYQVRVTDGAGVVKTGTYSAGTKVSWGAGNNIKINTDGSLQVLNADFGRAVSSSYIPAGQEGWLEFMPGTGNGARIYLTDKDSQGGNDGVNIYGSMLYITHYGGQVNNTGFPTSSEDVIRIQKRKKNISGTDHYYIEIYKNGTRLQINGVDYSSEVSATINMVAMVLLDGALPKSPPIYSSVNLCSPLVTEMTAQVSNEGLYNQLLLTTSGSVGPYTHSWTDGFKGNSRQGLPVGTYQVDVSNTYQTIRYQYGVGYKVSWNPTNASTFPSTNVIFQSDGSISPAVYSSPVVALSSNKIDPGQDGWVEYVNHDNAGMSMIFGVFYDNAGTKTHYGLKIQGSNVTPPCAQPPYPNISTTAVTLVPGDVLRVGRVGNTIIYLKNGVNINGSPQSIAGISTQTLYFFNSLVGGRVPYLVTSQQYKGVTAPTTIGASPSTIGNDYNFVTENTILVAGITDASQITGMDVSNMSQKITYFDGLGRPIQSVITQGSPDRKDIVQPVEYDAFGREVKKYLPYVAGEGTGFYKSNALGTGSMQSDFYSNTSRTDVVRDNFPFAETVFEASPLNRVLEQGAPGASWQISAGNTVKQLQRTNTENEVRLWVYDFATKTATSNQATGFYAGTNATLTEGQLFVSESKDENGMLMREYKDKEGKVVLKKVQKVKGSEVITDWIQTQYIYDDLSNLRFVIPPEGVNNLSQALTAGVYTINYTSTFTTNWLYTYEYDERQRMIEKQVPGGGLTTMVYDKADRLVLSQDANQRSNKQWSFTKYDAFSRPVMSGIYPEATGAARSVIQSQINAQTGNLFEQRAANPNGYSNTVLPTANLAIEHINYYDDYDFDNNGTADVSYQIVPGYPATNSACRGKPTGHKTVILNGTKTGTYLLSVIFYDKYSRTIQTQTDNILTGRETSCMNYDFSGKLLNSTVLHNQVSGTAAKTVFNKNTYDHAGRVLKTTMQVDTENEEIVGTYTYNSLGQLLYKTLGNGLQKVDYTYNIRGWLKGINPTISNTENDLFSFVLTYDDTWTTKQYNGNISSAYATVYNFSGMV